MNTNKIEYEEWSNIDCDAVDFPDFDTLKSRILQMLIY